MTWKSYTVVSGAGLLATWLVSTPTAPPERPAASRATAATAAVQRSPDIEEQAERLRSRVRTEAEYRQPTRNPFRFAARSAPPPRPLEERQPAVAEQGEAAPEAPAPPPPPLIRLAGVATDADNARRRTAILVTEQGIVTVREGDAVGAEYRVSRIEENAVELVAADGSVRRLTLRP